jgi:hypothetical protein
LAKTGSSVAVLEPKHGLGWVVSYEFLIFPQRCRKIFGEKVLPRPTDPLLN